MSSPSGVAGNVMSSPSAGVQEGGKKKRGVGVGGVEMGVGSESQNEMRRKKTPTTAGKSVPLAPGLITTPPRGGHVNDDDEVLAFDNDDLANDSDNNINNDHQINADQPSYVPTLLASPPSRAPPDAVTLKLSASMTHPLMGTSRCVNPQTYSPHTSSLIYSHKPLSHFHTIHPFFHTPSHL